MAIQYRVDHELDLRGLACPLPVVKTRKALDGLASGNIIKIVTSDPGTASDFRALVNAVGMELLSQDDQSGELHFFIRKP